MGVESGPGSEDGIKRIPKPNPKDYKKITAPDGLEIIDPDNQIYVDADMQILEERTATARDHFLQLAAHNNWETDLIQDAVETYHDSLLNLAHKKFSDDRQAQDVWFGEEVLTAFQEATLLNPSYKPCLETAKRDLEYTRTHKWRGLSDPNLS